MNKPFSILLLLIVASLPSSFAQQLSLDSCRAMALRNNTALQNARLEIASAKETKKATLTKYFPTLSLAAGYFKAQNYLIDVSSQSSGANIDVSASFDGQSLDSRIENLQAEFDRIGIDINLQSELDNFVDRFSYDITLQMINHGFSANAVLTQPIFAGGRIVNGNRLAKLGVDVAELKYLMSQREVQLNVEQYYWQTVALQLKLLTLDQAAIFLDTLCRDAQAAVDAGLLERSQLLKAQLKANEIASTRSQLLNGIVLSKMALCQYIGAHYSDSLSLVADIPLNTPPPAAAIPDSSFANRTEYSLLQKAVNAEQLRQRIIIGETLPQIALGSTYGISDITGTLRQNAILFATINIPLTAWWETAHNIRKQNIAIQIAQNNQRDNAQLLSLQQQQAFHALHESYNQIAIKQQTLSNATDNLIDVKNYYDAGLSSLSDYLEAQSLLIQAQNQLSDQYIDYKLKELRYRQLTP